MKIEKLIGLCIIACGILSGCGTLVPEKYLYVTPDVGSTKSLQAALNYSNTVENQLLEIQKQSSYTQSTLKVMTLGLSTYGATNVIWDHLSRVKGTALGLGALAGTDYMISPKQKRAIVDQGLIALECARQTAYTMDVVSDSVENKPTDATSPNPLAARIPQSMQGAPTPSIAFATGCVFHGNWTPSPEQTGHAVQRKLDTHSTANWTPRA